MTAKFLIRTMRNVAMQDRPYFAHLALTHRCNLRCRFCHIQDEKFEELDTEGMKRVIDVLDSMGVAVVSISGGGEPLLRSDFAAIIDYAAGKGLYTKITSNGTMPPAKYDQLLQSGISEIAISLDGVRGNDLPFSHVGPKILQSIRHLDTHLPNGKKLTLNVTISISNRDQVEEVVAYCSKEFPNARVWLNPVVTGEGKLRSASQAKVEPDYLDRCKSPTLLTAGFYNAGVRQQFRSDVFDWGCRAGRMFFDIKPNGDFWLCQDHASPVPLNILAPGFREQFRRTDVSQRRRCSGCTYSCYYVTQKGFEFKNWKDMATLWWQSTTRINEPCREVAVRYGWFAGLLSLIGTRVRELATAAPMSIFLALILGLGIACAQELPSLVSGETVIERMEQGNEARHRSLAAYQCERRYSAGNARLRRHAEVTARLEYRAPGGKEFQVMERRGSKAIQGRVLEPLMAAEKANAAPEARVEVDVCRRNYRFTFLGHDPQRAAYVFDVEPRTRNQYLFRGRIWVDAASYAIQRTEGEPARAPSFWVRKTRFVHEYGEFGGFWFPVRHRTDVELKLFGRSTLAIEYFAYQWRAQAPDGAEN